MKALLAALQKLRESPLGQALLRKLMSLGKPALAKLLVVSLSAGLAYLNVKMGVEVPGAEQIDAFVNQVVGMLFGGLAHFLVVDVPKAVNPVEPAAEAEQKIPDLESALSELRGKK